MLAYIVFFALISISIITLLYVAIWTHILFGYLVIQLSAVNDFLTSWKNNTFTIIKSRDWSTNQNILKISFQSKNGIRCVNIDKNGGLVSGVYWQENERSQDIKPSHWAQHKIQNITQQIAIMWKLEHGDLDVAINTTNY